MSVALSVRLPEPISRSLDDYVCGQPMNKSAVVSRALDEWIRMQSHPGIRFVALPGGERTAALERGPEVWTVVEAWEDADPADRSIDQVAHVTGLTSAEVATALRYYSDFTAQIDAELSSIRQAQQDAEAAWRRVRGSNAA
jgi:hypothetical protein